MSFTAVFYEKSELMKSIFRKGYSTECGPAAGQPQCFGQPALHGGIKHPAIGASGKVLRLNLIELNLINCLGIQVIAVKETVPETWS